MSANPNPKPESCPVSDAELLAYRDRELAPAHHRQIAVHVEQCPACQTRLAQAHELVTTLTHGTPARDNPVARAAIHDRIAADRTAWWRHRALVAAALPVALLVFVLVGLNRFQGDDCESCPPLTPPLQITSISGLPAGWGNPPTCQPATAASQPRSQAKQAANVAANLLTANRAATNPGADSRRTGSATVAHQLAKSTRPGANRPPAGNAAGANPSSANRPSAPAANACGPGQPPGAAYLSDAGLVRADQPGT